MRLFSLLVLSLGVVVMFSGCDQSATKNPTKDSKTANTTSAKGGDGHSHKEGEGGHDHGEAGHDHAVMAHSEVHGGHPIKIEGADFSAEWKHYSDNDVIEFFVLNKEGKADLPIKAEFITIRQKGTDDPETFKLMAVNPDADGKTAHFKIDDKNLTTAMHLGVEVEFDFDGKKTVVEIPPHAHHEH